MGDNDFVVMKCNAAIHLQAYNIPLSTRRCCNVESTSVTLIQRCNNVVWHVGYHIPSWWLKCSPNACGTYKTGMTIQMPSFCLAKPKGSNCLPYRQAFTAFLALHGSVVEKSCFKAIFAACFRVFLFARRFIQYSLAPTLWHIRHLYTKPLTPIHVVIYCSNIAFISNRSRTWCFSMPSPCRAISIPKFKSKFKCLFFRPHMDEYKKIR